MSRRRGSGSAYALAIVRSGGDSFPAGFDQRFELNGGQGEAFFGRDVLRGLVEGIREHLASRTARPSWRRQPALIGCSPWCNDRELLLALEELNACCVVVRKWPVKMESYLERSLERLEQFSGAGFPLRAFADLALHAPKIDDAPAVIGPHGPDNDIELSPFRTVGFREAGGRGAPMAHAKLALYADADVICEGNHRASALWVSEVTDFELRLRVAEVLWPDHGNRDIRRRGRSFRSAD